MKYNKAADFNQVMSGFKAGLMPDSKPGRSRKKKRGKRGMSQAEARLSALESLAGLA
jgi:hypothetical protein